MLYGVLPGSGNPRLSFPTVAHQLGLAAYWTGGSKRPAIVTLLSATYERERHRFCDLIEGVVRQSLSWRQPKARPSLATKSRTSTASFSGTLPRCELNYDSGWLRAPSEPGRLIRHGHLLA